MFNLDNLKDIANKLNQMAKDDQEMRNKYFDTVKVGKIGNFDSSVDVKNTERLKEIIQQLDGWPTISLVGKKTSHCAWLIAQHADHDPQFQQYCLELMIKARDDVLQRDIAYLTDRLAVKNNQPQEYATQFRNGVKGELLMGDVRDVENLDKRRAAVGLEPFAVYLQNAISKYSTGH